MSNQENNNNITNFLTDALKYLRNKGKKNGLDLSSDNFEKNLKEIIDNPNSEYADDVNLFCNIPELKKQEEELSKQIKTLKSEVDRLNAEVKGRDGSKGLEFVVEELENKKSDLECSIKNLEEIVKELEKLKNEGDLLKKQIYGDPSSKNELEKDGLLKYKNGLHDQIHSAVDGLEAERNELHDQIYSAGGLKDEHISLTSQINELIKKHSIVEKISELRSESISNQKFYYLCTAGMIGLIILSSCFAYCYGKGIINDITKIVDKDSRDYFGMFLMKIPFSLMIITFISGGFIFISKLLVIIERINNQLRNISQISVIASQIDQRTIDLISGKKSEDKTELSEAKMKKEEKALFYNLIADYLVNLSKNELELKEKKGSQLKMLKELASIIHKIKP